MASPPYGYVWGERRPVPWPVDSSTADIKVGDLMVMDTAGYCAQAAADANILIGVAMEEVDSPSADGDVTCLIDMSDQSVYYMPPDAGSVTAGLAGLTCDVGGPQSIKIAASTDDVIHILRADVTNNALYVSIIHKPAGVV